MKRTEEHWELERNQTGNDTQSRVILSFKYIQKRFINLKTEEKLPSSSLGKNFPFGWCFLENSWTDWQLAVSSQLAVSNSSKMTKTREKGKAKKKAEKSKEIKFNFWACMKYWWTKSYIGRDTSGTTIDCVSTECRLTIVRVSTNYRPTINCYIDHYINQVLTNYRPLYWPTDRSTLPTVNMICFSLQLKFFSEKPFYRNYSMLDSHTNTVISHLFAYSSRWHWKPWRGLLLQNTTVSVKNSWDTFTQSCF